MNTREFSEKSSKSKKKKLPDNSSSTKAHSVKRKKKHPKHKRHKSKKDTVVLQDSSQDASSESGEENSFEGKLQQKKSVQFATQMPKQFGKSQELIEAASLQNKDIMDYLQRLKQKSSIIQKSIFAPKKGSIQQIYGTPQQTDFLRQQHLQLKRIQKKQTNLSEEEELSDIKTIKPFTQIKSPLSNSQNRPPRRQNLVLAESHKPKQSQVEIVEEEIVPKQDPIVISKFSKLRESLLQTVEESSLSLKSKSKDIAQRPPIPIHGSKAPRKPHRINELPLVMHQVKKEESEEEDQSESLNLLENAEQMEAQQRDRKEYVIKYRSLSLNSSRERIQKVLTDRQMHPHSKNSVQSGILRMTNKLLQKQKFKFIANLLRAAHAFQMRTSQQPPITAVIPVEEPPQQVVDQIPQTSPLDEEVGKFLNSLSRGLMQRFKFQLIAKLQRAAHSFQMQRQIQLRLALEQQQQEQEEEKKEVVNANESMKESEEEEEEVQNTKHISNVSFVSKEKILYVAIKPTFEEDSCEDVFTWELVQFQEEEGQLHIIEEENEEAIDIAECREVDRQFEQMREMNQKLIKAIQAIQAAEKPEEPSCIWDFNPQFSRPSTITKQPSSIAMRQKRQRIECNATNKTARDKEARKRNAERLRKTRTSGYITGLQGTPNF